MKLKAVLYLVIILIFSVIIYAEWDPSLCPVWVDSSGVSSSGEKITILGTVQIDGCHKQEFCDSPSSVEPQRTYTTQSYESGNEYCQERYTESKDISGGTICCPFRYEQPEVQPQTPETVPDTRSASECIYKVQSGDILGRIWREKAKPYGISWEDLLAMNPTIIDPGRIKVNQEVIICKDSDQDGILDSQDKCPESTPQEVINGIQQIGDENPGCPKKETLPAEQPETVPKEKEEVPKAQPAHTEDTIEKPKDIPDKLTSSSGQSPLASLDPSASLRGEDSLQK